VTGDSTIKGFEGWIAVDGYDLGVHNTASIGSAGGGAGAGRAQFSPLTVDIHSLTGLTSLFGDVATGRALKSVELVGVESIKDQNIKVYDVKLSDVLVSSFENDPSAKGVETALTFNFAKIQLTDQPVARNGTLGTPQTFAFDINELKADAAVAASDVATSAATTAVSTAAATSAASAAVAVPASSPLHYFLKVDGVTGNSTVKGFEGWFAVDGYDLGVHNTASIGSAGGGAGVGRAQFSPLTIDLHSLTGLTSLFGDVATGRALKSVELVGVESIKDQNIKVYDVKLSDVLVSSFENDPSAKGVETALTFNFAKIQVTDQPVAKNGTLGTPQSFAFDLNELKAEAAVATSDVAASAVTTTASSTATTSAASAAVAVPASSPLHYFLKVDGVTGDSTIKGFEGWIAVDGYDLGVHNTASIGSAGGGAGAGRAQFSPLTVDIHSLTGLTSLFGDVATGRALKSVELVGVESIKDQNIKVYDVKLSDVLVSSFENDPSAKGVETALTFNFAKIQVTDQPVAKNGTLGTPQTFAFDLTELKADAALATSDVAASVVTADASSAATTTAASAAVTVPVSSPLHYFLKVDGVTGNSTVKGFEGWFAVDGYDLGVHNTASIGSASGGAGAGKAQFSPLTVDIHSLTGLTSLFGDVATGHALKSAELVGVESIKDQNIKVYDVKLSDVLVSSFENDPSAKGVETALTFNFAKIQVTDQPVAGNGVLGTPQTFAFDLNELKADAAVGTSDIAANAVTTTDSATATTSAASAAVAVPTSSPLQYFLKVEGVTGDSTVKGFEGWFAVDGYDIGVQHTASIGSAGGGAGAGRAQFSPLTVDIHSLSGLTSLFGDVATGHALKSVELVGVETLKDQNIKAYDLKLSDVLVSSFENDPSAKGVETALSFNYSKISLTNQPLTADGSFGTPQTFAFDLNELKADATVATSDVGASAQLNNMALALANFMASSNLGSAGSQELASTASPQQDNQLQTLAAHS
jgi:type VI protein secretion system component Hcp